MESERSNKTLHGGTQRGPPKPHQVEKPCIPTGQKETLKIAIIGDFKSGKSSIASLLDLPPFTI
jgi:hypothetical protein